MGTIVISKSNPSKQATIPADADINLSSYIKMISKYCALTQDEEKELAKKSDGGSFEAKRDLTLANLKLVVNIAKKVVHTSNLPMIDLIQEGNLGLMVAVDKFNWKLGYRFSTYASWWIKQAIFKAISEQSHSMRIPVYVQETLSKFSKIKSEMEQKYNCSVKNEVVAKTMNIEVDKIDSFLNAYSKTLSLEADFELNDSSEVSLADVVEDKKASANYDVEYDALKKDIREVMACLKERERQVLQLRFGLDNLKKQTLEEIGKIYGVTKECIRQTEARALKRLKNSEFGFDLFAAYII